VHSLMWGHNLCMWNIEAVRKRAHVEKVSAKSLRASIVMLNALDTTHEIL